MNRRRYLLGACTALALAVPAARPAQAIGLGGVTVYDPSNYMQWVSSLAAQAKQYGMQVQQYLMQAQQYLIEAQQLYGFIHAPSIGGAMMLLNMTGLSHSLPFNPAIALNFVRGVAFAPNGRPQIGDILASLSGFTTTAYSNNHVYTPTDASWTSHQIIARGNSIAGQLGIAAASINDYASHAAVLQPLRDRLASATTPKDVQDVQAQLAVESAWSQNQLGQQLALEAAGRAQSDSFVQMDNEKIDKDIDTFIASSPAK